MYRVPGAFYLEPRMKRAEINAAVAEVMAERGYSPGWYGWSRAMLATYSPRCETQFVHLPSGTSRKRLNERLAHINKIGASRPNIPILIEPLPTQLDIETAIAEAMQTDRMRPEMAA